MAAKQNCGRVYKISGREKWRCDPEDMEKSDGLQNGTAEVS
jgi:hypothetical protein